MREQLLILNPWNYIKAVGIVTHVSPSLTNTQAQITITPRFSNDRSDCLKDAVVINDENLYHQYAYCNEPTSNIIQSPVRVCSAPLVANKLLVNKAGGFWPAAITWGNWTTHVQGYYTEVGCVMTDRSQSHLPQNSPVLKNYVNIVYTSSTAHSLLFHKNP